MLVRNSYVLSGDHRAFDAQFFGVKPGEASAMDPQQRILLETTYEALESAGMPVEAVRGSDMGVFVGLMSEDYSDVVGRDIDNIPTYFAPGTSRSIVSNRVSYMFDLHGPSMTIDTACSSSLVALHQAVLSLRNGDCSTAIVAGTNLLLGPDQYVASSKLNMLSPSGRSRMWDAAADGYGRGDGVGVLVVKSLSKAIADSDLIECIIRETGVNQDGRTKGITVPSAEAQARLIWETYEKAGLDLSLKSDRPQYFEAHGTGTPAGDPREAEAISTTFFNEFRYRRGSKEPPLYVGSIKTVLGHAEGAAGIAGVMKASLALQHATIPPNLLLNELSPTVRPFYDNLQIAQEATTWPDVQEGLPRRASVNSFGFGGTNAHVILESFEPTSTLRKATADQSFVSLIPFIFSATSEASLLEIISSCAAFIRKHPAVSLRDLAWTLSARRTSLPVRTSISASTANELAGKLEALALGGSSGHGAIVGEPGNMHAAAKAAGTTRPRLLGVFTGQGAQWPTMCSHLLRQSKVVIECFERLQTALDTLPECHVPNWSLKTELLKDGVSSHINKGSFSQPLSTAVQIALVELLRAAHVDLAVVVGHSSGEIAAAYAAGHLTAEDAIRIAYYRGYFLDRPGLETDARVVKKGAMLAVSTTYQDAQELCDLPFFSGRISVAAINSPGNVTLSGDADAIEDAREVFEDEKTFARTLRVDKAYHSYHMVACARAYVEALRKCGIQLQERHSLDNEPPCWISSVTEASIEDLDPEYVASGYWADNMVKPVLFSQAINGAHVLGASLDGIIEIGPHPALSKPAMDSFRAASNREIPYIGTLKRSSNDIEAFRETLGSLWKLYGPAVVDFTQLDQMTYSEGTPTPCLVKGLPTYPWDHDRTYWHESRACEVFRLKKSKRGQLLGTMTCDGTTSDFRFKNRLKASEIDWLYHHQIEGEIVFPASGYVSAVVEAIQQIYESDRGTNLVEFTDVAIGKALVIPSIEGAGIETLLSLRVNEENNDHADIDFAFSSAANDRATDMAINATGKVRIVLGPPSKDSLPPPFVSSSSGFLDLEPDRFYAAMSELGNGYDGGFKNLIKMKRKMGEATGLIAVDSNHDTGTQLSIHPAVLDCAIQSLLLAYCFPGDGRMTSLHMPTKIDHLRLQLSACRASMLQSVDLPFYSSVSIGDHLTNDQIIGDVEVQNGSKDSTIIQLQGLHATPLFPPSAENDVQLFFETNWGLEVPTPSPLNWEDDECFAKEHAISLAAERVSYFYLRRLLAAFPPGMRDELEWHHVCLMDYAEHCAAQVEAGKHPYVRLEYNQDSESTISDIVARIDLKMIKNVGEGLESGLLGKSAGVGSATRSVMNHINDAFSSYTYTDISASFFEKAQEEFHEHTSRMAFQVLDIEMPVAAQGYAERSYDLVIASLVLHATRRLEETMAQVRKLLRPGGYLVFLEVTNNQALRPGLLFGALPGWWLGVDEGRKYSPCISTDDWRALLSRNGFSGIDAITPDSQKYAMPLSVLVCQAVDDQITLLREPTSLPKSRLGLGHVTVIGGEALCGKLCNALRGFYSHVDHIISLKDRRLGNLPFGGTVVNLAVATSQEPAPFKDLSATTFKAIQEIFNRSKKIIWVTSGAQDSDPYSNMFRGLQRTVALEMPDLRIQSLDFAAAHSVDTKLVLDKVLQLEIACRLEDEAAMQDLPFYIEPELLVRNGQVWIPRVLPSHVKNMRFNSTRRSITHDSRFEDGRFSIKSQRSAGGIHLHVVTDDTSTHGDGEIALSHSLLRSVPLTKTVSAYLSLGESCISKQRVLVLSTSLRSRVSAPIGWTAQVPNDLEGSLALLEALHIHLLALAIMGKAKVCDTIVVLNPGDVLGRKLRQLAREHTVSLVLVTTTTSPESSVQPWVRLHERSTKASVRRAMPPDVAIFVNMSASSCNLVSVLHSCLPHSCLRYERDDIMQDNSSVQLNAETMREVSDSFQSSWLACLNSGGSAKSGLSLPNLCLSHISEVDAHEQRIVEWSAQDVVSIPVQPASNLVRFGGDKTYWLVGLTGGLGLSLCRWMAERGARYIALSSRHPKIERSWLQYMASEGCTVNVFSSDVTSRGSVYRTYAEIESTMPPVAGVAHGAMVLEDTVFPDSTLERFEKVLKPKVNGSAYLDELFCHNGLDFFVCFSSLAYTVGNRGQSAYTAANAFLASLVAQRQGRGLAGSVIHIGGIFGEGYLARQLTHEKQSALRNAGFSFMSEQAFHELFAEGVLASPATPGSNSGGFDVASGLQVQGDNTEANFARNPMFQHIVTNKDFRPTSIRGHGRGKPTTTIKEKLENAIGDADVFDIIKRGFHVKLQSALQVELEEKQALARGPDELGVDSLVAVDLQSWFRKELNVEVTVMRLLNASSFLQLLESLGHEYCSRETKKDDVDHDLLAPEQPSSSVELARLPVTTERAPLKPIRTPDSGSALSTSSPGSPQSTSATSSVSHKSQPNCVTAFSDQEEASTMVTEHTVSASQTAGALGNQDMFERRVPMSFAQLRFWFLRQLTEDAAAFNVTTVLQLEGRVNIPKLKWAVISVAKRHEALRTAFFTDSTTNTHIQGVLAVSALHLEHGILSDEDDLDTSIHEVQGHVFDLSKGETFRIKLFSRSETSHVVILSYHHIVMDGISHALFLADLERAYSGVPSAATSTTLQYPDFSLRQIRERDQGLWTTEMAFWRRHLAELPPLLPLLSLSRRSIRPPKLGFNSHSTKFTISQALRSQLSQKCRSYGVTPYHFHLTVFQILLFRFSDRRITDLCIGVTDGNRKYVDVLQSIGLFLNILPLRFAMGDDHAFTDCLRNTKHISDEAFTNSRVPLDVLLAELNVPRSLSFNPLFQALFNYRPNVQDSREFLGCEASGKMISGGQHAYDITIDILESHSKEDTVELSVNSELYTNEDVENLATSYQVLLEGFIDTPEGCIATQPPYRKKDTEAALLIARGSENHPQWRGTLVHRIDQVIEAIPSSTALTDGKGHNITYGQMSNRITQIAAALLQLYGSSESGQGLFVGIMQQPGPDWVCSMLAVLRTGACCVPLDMEIGQSRLHVMIQSCKPDVILIDASTSLELESLARKESVPLDITKLNMVNNTPIIPIHSKADALAVISYTSGSTGTPKGVMLPHASYIHYVEIWGRRWGLDKGEDIILQQSPVAFDMSISQIFLCLGHGCTLVIPDSVNRRDPSVICDLILSQNITLTIATPTEYFAWIRQGSEQLSASNLRRAITGGEPVTASLVQAFEALTLTDFTLINVYGPTETTFGCADSAIPLRSTGSGRNQISVTDIGLTPLPNYAVYILDDEHRPVPVGIPGRIAIGGAGVSSGYLHEIQLTKEAFMPDQHASRFFHQQRWDTIHLTEDRGRYDTSGRLLLHDRTRESTLIKLGGIRMDLQDIENTILAALAAHVSQAVVSRRGDPQNPFLVAFVVLNGNHDTTLPTTRTLLAGLPKIVPLPQYMRPSLFIHLSSIPMTSSHKIDRAAIDRLAIQDAQNGSGSFIHGTTPDPTVSDMVRTVRSMWLDALPQDLARQPSTVILDTRSDFFHIGGNSISLINLQAIVSQRLHLRIPIDQLFQASNLGRMAALVQEYRERAFKDLPPPTSNEMSIDWDREVEFPVHLHDETTEVMTSISMTRSNLLGTIVLTGSTGFMGKEILRQLIHDERTTQVLCLAVRKSPKQLIPHDLYFHRKVKIFPGDLADRQLGLSDEDARSVFHKADAVIHAGADVSFMKSYASLRPANVNSTKELLRMCLSRRTPFHLVSTASVVQLSSLQEFGPRSVSDFQPREGDTPDHGYVASKWVSEVCAERVSQHFGLPVVIHRPSNVTGQDAPESDLMTNLIRYSTKTSTVPDTSTWRGYLNSVSVETAAKSLIDEVTRNEGSWRDTNAASSDKRVRYVYEAGEVEFPLNELKDHLQKMAERPLLTVPAEDWISSLEMAGMDSLLVIYLRQDTTELSRFIGSKKDKIGLAGLSYCTPCHGCNELLAPANVKFFNQDWEYIGTKKEWAGEISYWTGIPMRVLDGSSSMVNESIQERLSWINGRVTTNPEDMTYCLLGILSMTQRGQWGDDYFFQRFKRNQLGLSPNEPYLTGAQPEYNTSSSYEARYTEQTHEQDESYGGAHNYQDNVAGGPEFKWEDEFLAPEQQSESPYSNDMATLIDATSLTLAEDGGSAYLTPDAIYTEDGLEPYYGDPRGVHTSKKSRKKRHGSRSHRPKSKR
ncbi:polyketide synthase peptide synthetase [Seiridium cupressi]